MMGPVETVKPMVAMTVTQIEFTSIKKGHVVIPPNTVIKVDVNEGIALHEDVHFEINRFEYRLVS